MSWQPLLHRRGKKNHEITDCFGKVFRSFSSACFHAFVMFLYSHSYSQREALLNACESYSCARKHENCFTMDPWRQLLFLLLGIWRTLLCIAVNFLQWDLKWCCLFAGSRYTSQWKISHKNKIDIAAELFGGRYGLYSLQRVSTWKFDRAACMYRLSGLQKLPPNFPSAP